MHAAPGVGSCWDVPPADVFSRSRDGLGSSPQVGCGSPHTTQVVLVLKLPRPTDAEAMQHQQTCLSQVISFVGTDEDHWVPTGWTMSLPTRDQVRHGASWVRCDVAFTGSFPEGTTPARRSLSAEQVARRRPERLWACLAKDPRSPVEQPLVLCSKPHAYEEMGRLARIVGLSDYPTASRLRAASARCRRGLPPSQRSRQVGGVVSWESRSSWVRHSESGALYGNCWVHRRDGTPMPPR